MSKEKAREILQTLLDCDKRDVEAFQNEHCWTGYAPIEARIQFIEYRFKHFAGDVVAAIRELAKDEPQPNADGDQHSNSTRGNV